MARDLEFVVSTEIFDLLNKLLKSDGDNALQLEMLNFSVNCFLVSEYHIATPQKMYATLEQIFPSQLLVPHKYPLPQG